VVGLDLDIDTIRCRGPAVGLAIAGQGYPERGGFTTFWGGGLYIPIRSRGPNPISLDISAQAHANNDVQYLTKNSITITSSSTPPVITPVRSAADFVTFRLGVSVGIR
jgi:hypothetical protein